jgi:tetratricopeptide (TPR) repeat protein
MERPLFTDLSTTPVSETIRELSAGRKTGDLTISAGRDVKTIFVDHGRVVFAGSNVKSDRLGESLVSQGRLTNDDLEKAVTFMVVGGRTRHFGEALVEAGILDRRELGGSVARQVKQIVLSLFELDAGQSIFEERKCPIPLEFMVSLSVHRLLYVGIRQMKNPDLVRNGVGDLDRRVVLSPTPPFRFGTRKCSAEELEILDQATRPVTVRRLAWAPGGVVASRLRAVYAFMAAGVLDSVGREDADRQPVIQMETSTFLLSALRNRPDPSFREAIEQEVEQELARSDKFDRESWLNLSKSAPKAELVKALEDKMERYHQLLEAVGDDEEMKRDIEMILGRASAMLRLAKQTAAAEAATPPPTPLAEPPEMEEAAIEAAMPAAAKASAQRLASGSTGLGASGFQGAAYADHLLLEGQARMLVNDFANAAKVYEKLVDYAPDVPGYRARYAMALSRHPSSAKKAEREFLEAIRLDPDNADFRFQLGLYYKRMKQRSRALAELRTAVRLDPKHRGARQELEALSPKDSVLDNLRRLFK